MHTLDWDAMPIIKSVSSSFDPIDMISSWKICQRQEAAARLVAESVAAKSATGTSVEYCTKVGSPISPTHNNVSKFSNYPLAFCSLMPDFGSNTLIPNMVTGPQGFLDCLHTDTFEGDGISMTFSDDSKRLWWNNINTDNAVSSGESAIHSPVKKLDEMVSLSSSDNPQEIPMRSSEAKRYMTKRRHAQDLLETDCSTGDSSFHLISENQPKSKKLKSYNKCPSSSNINFQQASSSASSLDEPDSEAIAQMKEMIYRAAAFKPVTLSTEEVQKPKRKNVRISTDPQTVAARQRRERISEKIKILQKMVPGGNKMDTASILDEAANYLKFLRTQVKELEAYGYKIDPLITNFSPFASIPFNYPFLMQHNFPLNSIHQPMS